MLAGLVSFEAPLLADDRLLAVSSHGLSSASVSLESLLSPNFLL